MIKTDVKDLCEANEKMAWWAMVLFAEICDAVHHVQHREEPSYILRCTVEKVKEFEKLIIMNAVESAKESPSMHERVKALESKVFGTYEEGEMEYQNETE